MIDVLDWVFLEVQFVLIKLQWVRQLALYPRMRNMMCTFVSISSVISKSEIRGKLAVMWQLKRAGSKPFHSSGASWVRSDKPFPFSLACLRLRGQYYTASYLLPTCFSLLRWLEEVEKYKSYIWLLFIFSSLSSAFSFVCVCVLLGDFFLDIHLIRWKLTFSCQIS